MKKQILRIRYADPTENNKEVKIYLHWFLEKSQF